MDISVRLRLLGGAASSNDLSGSAIELRIQVKKKTMRLLIDNGLVQGGSREESRQGNLAILEYLEPKNIDYIILTHANMDHVGATPLLTKHGFGGKGSGGRIICTTATCELLETMLLDSAKIQKIEAGKKNGKSRPRRALVEALYSSKDVENTCLLIKNGGYEYDRWIHLSHEISVRFYPSGHILGGAVAVLRIMGKKPMYLGFSGDLGRQDGLIMPPPQKVQEPLDVYVTESTYGGKLHPRRDQEIAKLIALIKRAQEEKKKIIIPSFALQRTQEILHLLFSLTASRQIPRLPIFLDSPLATKITKIFADNWYSEAFQGQDALNFNPFDIPNRYLRVVDDKESSMELVKTPGPHIVIAGSGMCDAGRVVWHLAEGLSNEKTIVCLVGYMAKETLGRKLQDGASEVRINKTTIPVKAEIVTFKTFSAHADNKGLVDYAQALMSDSDHDSKIFIVHGEKEHALDLKKSLLSALPVNGWDKNIIIPKLREEFVL